MQTITKTALFSNKKTGFNILLFVLLYVILLQGFYLYVGITSPGGRLYSSFLDRYANFPEWLTILIAKTSVLLLKLAGYTVSQKNPANIIMDGGGGVNIAWGCLGVGAMSLWIGFIAAHRAAAGYKLKWMLAGIILICIVNILRVITIVISLHNHWRYPMRFDAHASFNILTYAVIVAFMYIFIRNYKAQSYKQ